MFVTPRCRHIFCSQPTSAARSTRSVTPRSHIQRHNARRIANMGSRLQDTEPSHYLQFYIYKLGARRYIQRRNAQGPHSGAGAVWVARIMDATFYLHCQQTSRTVHMEISTCKCSQKASLQICVALRLLMAVQRGAGGSCLARISCLILCNNSRHGRCWVLVTRAPRF